MILWYEPLGLLALALVPALVGFYWWARGRRAQALAAFVAAALLPAVAPDVDPRRRTIRWGLVTCAVLCLGLALGGPMWGFRWEEVRRQGIDLVIAVDTSRSMLATDVKPNRLARAKLAVQDLVAELHGDRVALVALAGSAFLQCPLTLDYGAFAQSLDAVEVGLIPRGGTALGAAIDTSLEAFEGRQGSHQALVLITDGEDHEGSVKEAAKRAAERGVKVYTVGIGTTEGELIPGETGLYVKDRAGQVVKSRLDEETLKEVAVDTGGVYLHAAGPSFGLGELYHDYIDTMEKRELASTLEKRFEHRFQVPLAIALVLLLLEPLVGERRPAERRAWLRRRPAGMTRVRAALATVALGALSVGWLDPNAKAREAARLYADGKYDDAVARYNEALTDQPDSALLHFNLGDAAYKQGKYTDALNTFQQVPTPDTDLARTARVAYNVGNVKYRLGEAAAASDPKAALGLWAEALVAYRRALGAAPDDEDAKFNHELVEQKIAELRKKLEEQQKEKEQQQQDQQEQAQQEKDKEQKEQQQKEQPQKDEQKKDQEAEQQQQQQADQKQQAGEQQAGGAEAGGEERKDGEITKQEATALLDSQRDQEVQPADITKRMQHAVVGEPRQDW